MGWGRGPCGMGMARSTWGGAWRGAGYQGRSARGFDRGWRWLAGAPEPDSIALPDQERAWLTSKLQSLEAVLSQVKRRLSELADDGEDRRSK